MVPGGEVGMAPENAMTRMKRLHPAIIGRRVRKGAIGLLTFSMLVAGIGSLDAAEYTWKGQAGSNRWGDARNWKPEGIPAAGDDVMIGAKVAVELGAARKAATLTLKDGASLVSGRDGALALGQGMKTDTKAILTLSGEGTTVDAPLAFGEIGAESPVLFFLKGSETDVVKITKAVNIGTHGQKNLRLILQEHDYAAHAIFSGPLTGSSGDYPLQIIPGHGAVTLAGNNSFQVGESVIDFGVHLDGVTSTLYLANQNALGDANNRLRVSQGVGSAERNRVARVLISEPEIQIENNLLIGRAATTEIGGGHSSGVSIWSGNILLIRQPEAAGVPDLPVRFVAAEGGTVEFRGQITDAAGGTSCPVEKAGAGTVVFSQESGVAFQGPLTVQEGALLVNNRAGSGTGAGPVTVESGSVLGGVGRIAPSEGSGVTVREGGVLLGGDGRHADGSLAIACDLSVKPGGVLRVILGPAGRASSISRASDTVAPTAWIFPKELRVEVLLEEGATPGRYSALLTGLSEDPGVDTWVVTTPGFEKSRFTYDPSGKVHLHLVR